MQNIKLMSVREFRESGYLQELNRQFLNPLGIALEVHQVGDKEKLGGIWDCRDDPKGMRFSDELFNSKEFQEKKRRIMKIQRQRKKKFKVQK